MDLKDQPVSHGQRCATSQPKQLSPSKPLVFALMKLLFTATLFLAMQPTSPTSSKAHRTRCPRRPAGSLIDRTLRIQSYPLRRWDWGGWSWGGLTTFSAYGPGAGKTHARLFGGAVARRNVQRRVRRGVACDVAASWLSWWRPGGHCSFDSQNFGRLVWMRCPRTSLTGCLNVDSTMSD